MELLLLFFQHQLTKLISIGESITAYTVYKSFLEAHKASSYDLKVNVMTLQVQEAGWHSSGK